jgi:putative ATPase
VEQQFMPDQLKDAQLWQAQNNPQEAKIKERMDFLWKQKP